MQIDGCQSRALFSRPQAVIARHNADLARNGATLVAQRPHCPVGKCIHGDENGVDLGEQGVIRADIPTSEDISAFIAPGPLTAAAPDAVTLD